MSVQRDAFMTAIPTLLPGTNFEPVTRKVLEAPRGKSGRNRLHFGEGGIRFGGVDVEEAYLYPPVEALA